MRLGATAAVLLLAACASPQQRMEQDIAHSRAMCLAAGYQAGSQALANCTITLARQAEVDRRNRVQAASEALLRYSQQLQQQQQQNAPHFTNCQQYGSRIECITQ